MLGSRKVSQSADVEHANSLEHMSITTVSSYVFVLSFYGYCYSESDIYELWVFYLGKFITELILGKICSDIGRNMTTKFSGFEIFKTLFYAL